jgi:two-component system, NtrC family, nitrogen regulation sensor histidine kinase GlnL
MARAGGGLIRFARKPAPAEGPALTELFAALPAPLLVINPEGRVTDANAASETLLNLSRASTIGKKVQELLGSSLTLVSSDAQFAAYDIELSLPGNRPQRCDLMVAPLPERPGWRLVTIHSRARSHLVSRRPEREGGTLAAVGAAAMLAHEIKNPLSAIRGAAQLLEASADAESRDLTRLIRDEVDRVAALIDRMEGFTDTRPLDLAPQNIHSILDHVRDVALQGFARGITIREVYDPSLPAVLGHRDSLVQVLINLLKNAAEAMHDAQDGKASGVITLTTAYRHGVSLLTQRGDRRQSLQIEVCVIDQGPGAPPEIEEHLFDPFVSSKRSGRGLGLALVDKLIADQGGMVEYAREGDPARTVFRLLLPRARAAA